MASVLVAPPGMGGAERSRGSFVPAAHVEGRMVTASDFVSISPFAWNCAVCHGSTLAKD